MSHRSWFQKSHISNFVSTDLVSLKSQMITTKTDGSNELLVTSTSFKGVHGVCFHWGSDEFRFLMDTVCWHVATAGVSERTDLEILRFLKWFFSGQTLADVKLSNLKPSWSTFNPSVSFRLDVIRSHKTRHDLRSMPLKFETYWRQCIWICFWHLAVVDTFHERIVASSHSRKSGYG